VRWLLLKDLQILRRSPLLVVLLIAYPVVVALLIGFALSRGPEKPRVAIVNEVAPAQRTITLGNSTIKLSHYSRQLAQSVKPVFLPTRARAVRAVRSGDVQAAVIIPPDLLTKLEGGLSSPRVEVVYNTQDPVKARYVRSDIDSRLAQANQALSEKLIQVGQGYIHLLLTGGRIDILGRHIDVLGLRDARAKLTRVAAGLPPRSKPRAEVEAVVAFVGVALRNLGLSTKVLRTVGQPLRVTRTDLRGSHTPIDHYAIAVAVAISLMFVTVLLASGLLALEREEHALTRLIRGLVSRLGLIAEKAILAGACALVVSLAMLAGIAGFVGLDFGRFGLWLGALAAGGLAFGALGVAIGGVAREVRAASLLAFLLALPLAFLALVPSGAVSGALYDAISAISAIFPFKPTLQALDAAVNASGGIAAPIGHLVGLAVGFGIIGRLALRRLT
jgi:ABC-2 type transport system permease protein